MQVYSLCSPTSSIGKKIVGYDSENYDSDIIIVRIFKSIFTSTVLLLKILHFLNGPFGETTMTKPLFYIQ